MLFKISKGLVVMLLAATVCSAASIIPRYENDSDGSDRAGKVNAAAVCVQGQNDPQLSWDRDIRNHVFTGDPATCYGAHVTSAVEQAVRLGTIRNLQVASSNSITRLMNMQWTYGSGAGQQCQKTVWNNIQNYRLLPGLGHYSNESIHDIFIDIILRTQCLTGALVVDNRYGSRICAQVVIGTLPSPGRSFYPRSINLPAGAPGTAC